MKLSKSNLLIILKGFCMGTADIVPGVSGGTVALITGIYDNLIESISSVNKEFLKLLFQFKIKACFEHINGGFLLPLLAGIFLALIMMSKIVHYFMNEYTIYTWSLFFGLIIASIIYVAKLLDTIHHPKMYLGMLSGAILGYFIVTAIPVETPETTLLIFASGAIAICAMILPGISGSFILLVLGKYFFVTSALKNPMVDGNVLTIITFALGCLVGLLAFSKLLNFLLHKYHDPLMSVLVGFMVGSLRKIWPWRTVLEEKVIRGKTHVLKDSIYFPTEINSEAIIAFAIMIFGIVLVFSIEKFSKK